MNLNNVPSVGAETFLNRDWNEAINHGSIIISFTNSASIMASATLFFFCTTQKHLIVKIAIISMA
jgi:hypothetical protein